MEEVKAKSGVWKGVLAGGIIGASAALLLAPKSGPDLRKKLRTDLDTLKERSGKLAADAQEKVSVWGEAVRETSRERLQLAKDAASGAIDTIKESASDLKDSAGRVIGTIKDEAKDAAGQTREVLASETAKLANSDNSSLAQNAKEMEKLGKEMDQMKTGSELKKEGKVPDPVQTP